MQLTYVLILAACFIGTLPLEFVLGTRVYARWRQLLVALAVPVIVFVAWDVAAIRADWWSYDPARVLGVTLPGSLPLEELLFFLVIPTCAVLSFEAVRAVKPRRR